ncbi:MAG: aminomethyl-transferring glycine dehydrogenase [Ignavibacteria bacterium]|nr:aminomethyl-transferring glycine dehydrogenase [Ignavibacteria bacterium]
MTNPHFDENDFQARQIGPRESDLHEMLGTIGVKSLDELISQTIPASIRLRKGLRLPPPISEYRFLRSLREIAWKNRLMKSYLGQGYYGCITPSVILRNIFENPGWYTQYTPYQPEISQGRLEALLNYQTMVMDMTGMDVANASLLDEGTAAAEAMTMLHGIVNKQTDGSPADKFFVSDTCWAQTIDVIRTRASAVGIEVVVGDHNTATLNKSFFGVILQYPGQDGAVTDCRKFIEHAHGVGALVVVASDLLSLALLTPPGELGADVVVGNSQRFGVPMGYGGPHAGFFATRNEYIRQMPGRIIGVSIDAQNDKAYRMTLQTREQHIRREKATSNICTAQALLAIMAGMYAVYHGPGGIRRIAARVHVLAKILEAELNELGYKQHNGLYFDTLKIVAPDGNAAAKINLLALEAGYNLRTIDEKFIGISLDETTDLDDITNLITVFAEAKGRARQVVDLGNKYAGLQPALPAPFARKSAFLQHPIFNTCHSETEMMRYIKSLENRDLSLMYSMIPLGSCTMKLNAATELMPVTWPEFSSLHPFIPLEQCQGYQEIFRELGDALCEITGFAAASLQPNSGAQGEFTGLMVVRAYLRDQGQGHRDVVLIPSSAHGTNPASAVMAGLKVVVVNCDDRGNIDVGDLRSKASAYKDVLASLMVTYPSTHGVFEEEIREICEIVHQNGGQVYMDGANLNAQVGLTSPGLIGADVCHINLHKTFGIPHGGGGPGMGPICVASHLAPYLPGHPVVKVGGSKAIRAVASAPWGSPSILLISYAYIKMLGSEGLTEATRYAILNANYLKSRLEKHYPVLYQGVNGRIGHEFILNTRGFKESAHVEVEDIAKRLMDYGFHAPTVSFPVPGTLMIEPTESEPKAELDRFADALIAIRHEIEEIIDGKADKADNVLKNAPHTARETMKDEWKHPYTRAKAAFPLPFLRDRKFWPAVGRINSTYGDRNLVCSCPPIESYADAESKAD